MRLTLLFILLAANVVMAADEPRVYFYIKDHLGSTRMIIDREETAQKLDDIANNRTQNYDQKGIEEVSGYYPFGKQMPGKGANNIGKVTTEKFTGKELDDEGQIDWDGDGVDDPGEQGLDLSYFVARYYDAEIGKWTCKDPAAQFKDLYAYAGNHHNPINAFDDKGLKLRFAEGVSQEFKNEFARAIRYLNKHEASSVFAKLEARPEIILLREGVTGKSSTFSSVSMAITWSPYTALKLLSEGSISPAVIAVHEAGHALDCLQMGVDEYQDLRKVEDAEYKNKVEKSAVENYEIPAAQKTGEGQRVDYYDYNKKPIIVKHADEKK